MIAENRRGAACMGHDYVKPEKIGGNPAVPGRIAAARAPLEEDRQAGCVMMLLTMRLNAVRRSRFVGSPKPCVGKAFAKSPSSPCSAM